MRIPLPNPIAHCTFTTRAPRRQNFEKFTFYVLMNPPKKWFTNIADMIMLLLYANAPSALSTLFGRFWVVLPPRRSQSKKKNCWNVEGPVFYMCNSGFRSVWFNMGLAAALRTESTRCFFLLSWPFSLAGKHRSSPNSAPCHKLVIVAVWPTTMQVERQFFPNVASWCKQCVPEINQKNCRTPRICPPTAL